MVPQVPDAEIDWSQVDQLFERWERAGFVDGDAPGPNATQLIEGGFQRLWCERPKRVRLFGNQQGGFYTHCPKTGDNIAAAFQRALLDWRTGGERALRCPSCAQPHALEDLEFRPMVAFARGAVVFGDVETTELADTTLESLEGVLGSPRVILRRVG